MLVGALQSRPDFGQPIVDGPKRPENLFVASIQAPIGNSRSSIVVCFPFPFQTNQ